MSSKVVIYLDETGKGEREANFIVAIVIVPFSLVEQFKATLLQIEAESERRRRKWKDSNKQRRDAYFEQVLQAEMFINTLFAVTFPTLDGEIVQKCQAIAESLQDSRYRLSQIQVKIDGEISRTEQKLYKQELKKYGLKVDKVRGVRKTSDDPISRFADACCGLVRACEKGQMRDLYDHAVENGVLITKNKKPT